MLRLGSPAAPVPDVHFLNPEDYAEVAGERLRAEYPEWALRLSREAGLVDLYTWRGVISYWWLVPFSENNALRTPLIQHLYWLCLAEVALEKHPFEHVHLISDVPGLSEPLRSLVGERLRTVDEPPLPPRPGKLRVFATAWRQGLRRLAKWAMARVVCPLPARKPRLALFSFYPNFFAEGRERLFGDFCDKLEAKGEQPLVVAQWTGGRRPPPGVLYQEALLTLSDILRVGLDFTFLRRYLALKPLPVPPFRGWRLDLLARAAVDREVLMTQEGPHAATLALATANLVRRYPSLRTLCVTFENQPRERALQVGLRLAGRRLPVVAFEISMFSRMHLPWYFAADSTFQPFHQAWDPSRIPVVDYLVAYGTAARDHFQESLQHVALAGAVRYFRLAQALREPARDLGLPGEVVLVALPYSTEDALILLNAALAVARRRPKVTLAVKFHPLNRFPIEPFERLRVFEENLYDLIKSSRVMLSGVSCVGVEALVLECRPIMLSRPGAWEANPLRDYPGVGSYCANGDELERALELALDQPRAERWDRQDELISGLDGQAAERAYQALVDWRLL